MPSRLDQVSRALFARLSEREDSEIEGLNDAYRGALEQTIERVVGDLPRDADGRLEPDPVALARLRREFDRFGDAQGASLLLEQHVERVSAALTRQVDVLSDGWQRLGEDPLESDQLALSTLVKANYLDGFTELGRYHHNALRDAVMRQALGRATERDLRAELQRITGKAASEVDRQHHDAVIGYSRAVISESAEQRGYEHFQYIGPDDSANRPFCDRHVDKIYTREEIDALDNGQIANVFLTGGGYRCRHHWRPVRPEWFSEEERDVLLKVQGASLFEDPEGPWNDVEIASIEDAVQELIPYTERARRIAELIESGDITLSLLDTASYEAVVEDWRDNIIEAGSTVEDFKSFSGFAASSGDIFVNIDKPGVILTIVHEGTHAMDWLAEADPTLAVEPRSFEELEIRAYTAEYEYKGARGWPQRFTSRIQLIRTVRELARVAYSQQDDQ